MLGHKFRPLRVAHLKPENRASKSIAVTPAVLHHLNAQRRGKDTVDDVLRRILGIDPRV